MTLPTYNTSVITALSRIPQDIPQTQFIFGGNGGASHTTFNLQKKDTVYHNHNWRSGVFKIGKKFDVLKITFPIFPAMDSNMSVIPVLYFDNQRTSSVGTTLNVTNYSNSEKIIRLTSKNFSNVVRGHSNFFLELQFTGTALITVGLPISIEIEIYDT